MEKDDFGFAFEDEDLDIKIRETKSKKTDNTYVRSEEQKKTAVRPSFTLFPEKDENNTEKKPPEEDSILNNGEPITIAALVAHKIKHRKSSAGKGDKKPAGDPVKEKRKIGPVLVLRRFGLCLGSALAILIVFLVGVLLIIHHGPSVTFRDMFTMTVTESSAGDFLATWFLSDETIEKILAENQVEAFNGVSSGDGVVIATPNPDATPDPEAKDFEIVDVSGKTYNGKMIIVRDPSRIKIGTPPGGYGEDRAGMSTIDMAKHYNALAAINGGGFYDTGKGNGGVPTGRENSSGIVISNGEMLWGSESTTYEVIGLDKEGKLFLGSVTGAEALERGIVEALNFGPFLIVDGEPCVIGSSISEGGLNPRSAIGQRSDGAILLLVINGRQANSLGASYDDLISVMMDFGAVNAANLDGGSSSYMVYENEIITQCASLYGPRKMATSVLVTR